MIKVYSTGPVENAGFETSLGLIIKVLNNNSIESSINVTAQINVYSLNGEKTEIFTSHLIIPPQSSQFETVDVAELLEFEVVIHVENANNALVSIWGKDENGKLVAAHRFVQEELNIIKQYEKTGSTVKPKKIKSQNIRKRTR